jgi:hypothetical protein
MHSALLLDVLLPQIYQQQVQLLLELFTLGLDYLLCKFMRIRGDGRLVGLQIPNQPQWPGGCADLLLEDVQIILVAVLAFKLILQSDYLSRQPGIVDVKSKVASISTARPHERYMQNICHNKL